MSEYRIDALHSAHDKQSFCCGEEALDNYLKKCASQDMRRHVSSTYAMTAKGSNTVIGYYTLAASSIYLDELPVTMTKRLPKYPLLPATLLGRLGVDHHYQKKQLGELLLVDALKRSYQLSKEIASLVIVVDAKSDRAAAFYSRYGFISYEHCTDKLFLPMTSIVSLHVKNGGTHDE